MARKSKSLFDRSLNNKAVNPLFQDLADSVSNIATGGFREITVATAADASHTLTASDHGVVLISADLANSSVIKLPTVTEELVGWKTRLIFTGTGAGAAKVQLPNAGDAVFAGVVTVERSAGASGVADAAAVNRVEVVVGADEKSIELDENDVTFGGAVGSVLDIHYASLTKVVVTGRLTVNVASTPVDALTATTFTATGY